MNRHLTQILVAGLAIMTFTIAAEPKALTPKLKEFINPVWSPDGSQIAVSQSGYRGVWLVDSQSHKMTLLTDANAAGFGMAWSHDGRYLATTENQGETIPRRTAIRVYDVKGNTQQLLSDFTTRLTGTLFWSRNSQGVFLVGHTPLQNAFFRLKNETPTVGLDFFSIQGDQIVSYNTASQIMTTLGTNSRFLNLQISPDGETYVCEKLGGGLRIGNQTTVIADLPRGERPRWSVDGQSIVYQIATDDGERILQSDIWRVSVDGSQVTQITDTPNQIELNPSLSPDNRYVAYEELTSRQIFILSLTP